MAAIDACCEVHLGPTAAQDLRLASTSFDCLREYLYLRGWATDGRSLKTAAAATCLPAKLRREANENILLHGAPPAKRSSRTTRWRQPA